MTSTANVSDDGDVYLTPIEEAPGLTYFMLVALVPMILVGVFGNLLVLLSFVVDKKLRLPGNLFIVNLAMADFVVSAIMNPFTAIAGLEGRRYFDERWALCEFLATFCLIACICSLWTMLAISFNRFIIMVHFPLYSKIFTWTKTSLYCVLLWFIASLVSLPTHLGWTRNWFDEKLLICFADRTAAYSFSIFLISFAIFTPIGLISFFYLKIYLHVTKARAAARKDDNKGQKDEKAIKEQQKNTQLAKTLFTIFVGRLSKAWKYGLSKAIK